MRIIAQRAGAFGGGTAPAQQPGSPPDPQPDPRPETETPAPAASGSGDATPSRQRRVYLVDLLRFVAALAVVLYHLVASANAPIWDGQADSYFSAPVRIIGAYGWLGVECFFIISGFVICMSSWGRSISGFFVSRVTRLMPAYLCAVLLTSAVLTLWPNTARPEPSHVLINLTLMQGFLGLADIDVVYWTLFFELKFYLLFAIVVYFGLTYRRVVLFCLLWMTFGLYAVHAESSMKAVLMPNFAGYFVVGIVLYLIHRYGPNLLLWCMLAMSLVLSLQALYGRVQDVAKLGVTFPVAAAVLLGFVLIMVAVALGWTSWFRWRGTVILGSLTYPLYLLHNEIGMVVLNRLHDSVSPRLLAGLLLAGLLLLSYLVTKLVERPVAGLLRRGLKASFEQIRSADRPAG